MINSKLFLTIHLNLPVPYNTVCHTAKPCFGIQLQFDSQRSGWVTISYSKVISVILYVASEDGVCPDALIMFL